MNNTDDAHARVECAPFIYRSFFCLWMVWRSAFPSFSV